MLKVELPKAYIFPCRALFFSSVINFEHAGFSVMYNHFLLYFTDVEKSTEMTHDLKLKVGWKKNGIK